MQDNEIKAFAFACIDKVKQSNISKLSVQNGDFSLTIEAQPSTEIHTISAEPKMQASEPEATGKIVPAPLVGTFYTANSPEEPPMVQAGDSVKKGDVLCIIEAMKIMNNIESPYDGKISRVLAANGDLVEYNQPLFVIEE